MGLLIDYIGLNGIDIVEDISSLAGLIILLCMDDICQGHRWPGTPPNVTCQKGNRHSN
jgi:hypothetical protein